MLRTITTTGPMPLPSVGSVTPGPQSPCFQLAVTDVPARDHVILFFLLTYPVTKLPWCVPAWKVVVCAPSRVSGLRSLDAPTGIVVAAPSLTYPKTARNVPSLVLL